MVAAFLVLKCRECGEVPSNSLRTSFTHFFSLQKQIIEEKQPKSNREITHSNTVIFQGERKEEIEKAPQIFLDKSSFPFGTVKKGSTVSIKANISNPGKTALRIYKVETGDQKMEIHCPSTVPAGGKAVMTGTLTVRKAEPDMVFVITLVTNSPDRPLVILYLNGTITD